MRNSHCFFQLRVPYFAAHDVGILIIGKPQPLSAILSHEFTKKIYCADITNDGSEEWWCIFVTTSYDIDKVTVGQYELASVVLAGSSFFAIVSE